MIKHDNIEKLLDEMSLSVPKESIQHRYDLRRKICCSHFFSFQKHYFSSTSFFKLMVLCSLIIFLYSASSINLNNQETTYFPKKHEIDSNLFAKFIDDRPVVSFDLKPNRIPLTLVSSSSLQ